MHVGTGHREARAGQRVAGIQRQRTLERRDGGASPVLGSARELRPPPQVRLVRRHVVGVPPVQALLLDGVHAHGQGAAHPLGDRVLQREQVLAGQVVMGSPEGAAVRGAKQLHADPEPVRGRLHGAGEHVVDAQLPGGRLRIGGGGLVAQDRGGRPNPELVQGCQPTDDRVGNTHRQNARVAADAQRLEREHRERNRPPVGCRPGPKRDTAPAASARTAAPASNHRRQAPPALFAGPGSPARRSSSAAAKLPAVRKPVRWHLGQRAGERAFDGRRHRLARAPHGRHGIGQPVRDDRLGRGTGVRRLAGQHLVEHAPESVDVGPRVHRGVAHRLLRTHVGRGPQRQAGGGQCARLGPTAGDQLRDAEVRQQRVAAAQQDVLGFHVPVDDAVLVGAVEGVGDLADDGEGVGHGELPLARQPGPEGLALDAGHGVPEELGAALAGDRAAVEHGQDVGVLEPGGEADLAQEPVGADGGRELGPEHLQRDGAVVPKVVGQPDLSHAPAAELALEAVAILQDRTEGMGVEHTGLQEGRRTIVRTPGGPASTPAWNRSRECGVLPRLDCRLPHSRSAGWTPRDRTSSAPRTGAPGPLAQRHRAAGHDRERAADLRGVHATSGPAAAPLPEPVGRQVAPGVGAARRLARRRPQLALRPGVAVRDHRPASTSASWPCPANGARCCSARATSAPPSRCSSTTSASGQTHPPQGKHNALQKGAYTFIVAARRALGRSPASPSTSRSSSPGSRALFGGYELARYWHFWAVWIFVGFTLLHVALVFLVDPGVAARDDHRLVPREVPEP